jgi:hypothetical protein
VIPSLLVRELRLPKLHISMRNQCTLVGEGRCVSLHPQEAEAKTDRSIKHYVRAWAVTIVREK